jgi:hypothetical protein
MKKILLTLLAAGLCLSAAYSYNPPAGGEDLTLISSPSNLSGANSVAGGALFDAGSTSIIVNPALTSDEQRVNLNVGYTFLYSTEKLNDSQLGGSFQTGILIPFKLYVFSGLVNGTFAPYGEMHLGDSINLKAGLSKEITEKLSVGLGAGGGFAWTTRHSSLGKDWSLYADVGALYKWGNLGPFTDFRIGGSVLNLGKMYTSVTRVGIDETAENTQYPTLATLKAGAAGTILSTDVAKIGLGLDLTVPCFQNLIMDLNAQVQFKDAFIISVGEKFNLAEMINKKYSLIPSVAFLFKFSFDVKNNEYLESHSWSQSEMTVSAGYKNLYKTVHAISAGVDVDLGMADTEAPKIVVWDDKE